MPLLFSYGMLQKEHVQHSLFGRRLEGRPDELIGFELGTFIVDDAEFVAESGKADHVMVRYSGDPDHRVAGVVFELTQEELEEADRYEPDGWDRITTRLASGYEAWVYAGDANG